MRVGQNVDDAAVDTMVRTAVTTSICRHKASSRAFESRCVVLVFEVTCRECVVVDDVTMLLSRLFSTSTLTINKTLQNVMSLLEAAQLADRSLEVLLLGKV